VDQVAAAAAPAAQWLEDQSETLTAAAGYLISRLAR